MMKCRESREYAIRFHDVYYERRSVLYLCNPLARRAGVFWKVLQNFENLQKFCKIHMKICKFLKIELANLVDLAKC